MEANSEMLREPKESVNVPHDKGEPQCVLMACYGNEDKLLLEARRICFIRMPNLLIEEASEEQSEPAIIGSDLEQ
jgi:hypothetical protein